MSISNPSTVSIPSLSQPPTARASTLLSLLSACAQGEYIGESISQLEHSLQCAHQALLANAPPSTITAALLHDIGQFLPLELLNDTEQTRVGRPNHATTGAEYLKGLGFGEEVTSVVREHVNAKKWLCATDPAYSEELSEASKASLWQQGGPMKESERAEWERTTVRWEDCVRVRRWDDAAKVVGVERRTPRLESYVGILVEVLKGNMQ